MAWSRSDMPVLCRVKAQDGTIIEDTFNVFCDCDYSSHWEDMHPDGIGYWYEFIDDFEVDEDSFWVDEKDGELLEVLDKDSLEFTDIFED